MPPGRLHNCSDESKGEYMGLVQAAGVWLSTEASIQFSFSFQMNHQTKMSEHSVVFLLAALWFSCSFRFFSIPHQRCVEMQQQIYIESRSEGCMGKEGQNKIYFLYPRSFLWASLFNPKKKKKNPQSPVQSHFCHSLLLMQYLLTWRALSNYIIPYPASKQRGWWGINLYTI